MARLKQVTELARHQVALVLKEGDIAVDATAGNGYDTLFLAEKVGPKGFVYAFDIQKEALAITAGRLKERNIAQRVALINSGHESLSEFVREPAAAVMYNLGYLPGGERQITTAAETTLESIRQALSLLLPGGVITVVLYPGHRQGLEEKKLLLPYLRQLAAARYAVLHTVLLNQGGEPPELVVLQKNLFPADRLKNKDIYADL